MAIRNALGTLLRLLVLVLAAGVAGCGGGGGFDSAYKAGESSWQSSTEIFEAQIAGSVGDGPIINARLRVYSNAGALVAEGTSNSKADYNLTVRARGVDFPLVIVADQGIDLVTNAAPDFSLASVIMRPGSGATVNLNPYSTLIVKAAQSAGGVNPERIATATEAVVKHYGFGLNTDLVPDPLFTPMDEHNVHVIVKASETLGEMIRRTRDALITSGTYLDGDDVVKALAADLSDGWVDGRGAHGHDARIAAVANVSSAAVMLEALSNRLHVYGVDATEAMDNAIRIVRPSAPEHINTRNVPISEEAVIQTLVALEAAMLLSSDTRLSEAYAAVATTEIGSTVAQVLPAGIDQLLNDVVTTAAYLYDDDQHDALNDVARGVDAGEFDFGGGTSTSSPGQSDSEPDSSHDTPLKPVDDANSGSGGASDDDLLFPSPAPSDELPAPEDADLKVENKPFAQLWENAGWLLFDGEADLLNTGVPLRELRGSSFTFEAVVQYTDKLDHESWIPVFGSSHGPSYSDTEVLFIGKNSRDDQLHVNIGGVAHFSMNSAGLFDGNERHFALVLDRDASELRLYVDGALVQTRNAVTGSFDGGSELLLGAVGHSQRQRWSGWIGPARVVNTALPHSEFLSPAGPRPNTAPVILGAPSTALVIGNPWSFTPSASDADGDVLTFAIQGKPEWASFDPKTGHLAGTPPAAGSHGPITVSVSDGRATVSLKPFTLQIDEPTVGSATVSWQPPTTRTDGTALSELAGYRVYYGKDENDLTHVVEITNAGQTSQHIENLDAGKWYFAVTALCSKGLESPKSEMGSKTIM